MESSEKAVKDPGIKLTGSTEGQLTEAWDIFGLYPGRSGISSEDF